MRKMYHQNIISSKLKYRNVHPINFGPKFHLLQNIALRLLKEGLLKKQMLTLFFMTFQHPALYNGLIKSGMNIYILTLLAGTKMT